MQDLNFSEAKPEEKKIPEEKSRLEAVQDMFKEEESRRVDWDNA